MKTEINEDKGRRWKKKHKISGISSKTETDLQNEGCLMSSFSPFRKFKRECPEKEGSQEKVVQSFK